MNNDMKTIVSTMLAKLKEENQATKKVLDEMVEALTEAKQDIKYFQGMADGEIHFINIAEKILDTLKESK